MIEESEHKAIYKLETKADDYPFAPVYKELEQGDQFVIRDNGENYKIGARIKDYPAAVHKILYYPKKWWQFWKKKRPAAYIVVWKGEEGRE